MSVSPAPLVKAYLLEQLPSVLGSQSTSADSVAVSYGAAAEMQEGEAVALRNIRHEQVFAEGSGRRRDENAFIETHVWVQHQGWTQQQTTERAYELLGIIEDFCRSDVRLGGLVMWCEIQPTQLYEGLDDAGRQALLDADVHYRARI